MSSIEERIDKLLGKDFEKTTTEEIVSIITGGEGINGLYEDPQSDDGFNKELEKSQKEVENILASLEPQKPPIPMKRIEELACTYEGDDLYSVILLESLKKQNPKLYSKLIDSDEFKNNSAITEKDLGITVKNSNSFKYDFKIPSRGITDFLKVNDQKFLEKINENIFDNLDPLILGKPSNSGSRKKRDINILGFKIPLEFIMSGKKVVHVKIGGEDGSISKALDKINNILNKQNVNSNPCDFKDVDEDTIDENTKSVRIDEYDSNFFPDGDDPIIDEECLPGVPEDPITGDPITTRETFNDISEDFCDPPAFDFSDDIPDENDPEPTPVDVNSIEGCINSALDKSKKIEEDSKLLARWLMIEKNLEEILYHYEIIYEYQKSLSENWKNRIPANEGGDPSNFGIAINILTYNDQIIELDKQILNQQEKYNADLKVFLENNEIFTEDLFLLNILDTELNNEDLTVLFNDQILANKSPINYNENNQLWPVAEGVTSFENNKESIVYVLIQKNFIEILNSDRLQTIALRDADLVFLSNKLNKPLTFQDLEKGFIPSNTSVSDLYGQGESNLDVSEKVFESPFQNIASDNPYDSYGYEFLKKIKEFSIRFKEIKFNKKIGELQFELSFMSDYGSPLPYKRVKKPSKISLQGPSTNPLEEVNEPDSEKIKIGNEYAGNGGLLKDTKPSYLESYQFIKINNLRTGTPDVAKFYDFIETIIKRNDSKSDIIQKIVKDRGILYGQLIEKSASPWLFFSQEERGDNDSRDPSKVRPSSFIDGEPNQSFNDFWGNFKPNWDSKYQENKKRYIEPALEVLKTEARKAGEGLGKTLPTGDVIGVRIFENYFNVKQKYEQIQDTILYAAQKRAEIEESLSPEGVGKSFSDIKCSGSEVNDPNDPENCPPVCCGQPGSDFKSTNYLMSSPPSSDCPTMFQKCWWKQFCKDVTKVGLLPYPNGLPPIENSQFFLAQGPSIRLGLKYWPVGYLPPAFIPIPIPNPIDGQPYIRIPLPMIWTIIPPIVIPLPLNLGVLVIFIPLIGGFMPTPLVYLKEFITGSSLFLTGIRGPRFIPRKSDPELKDPLEKIKQALSFGIPDKLIPLPGFGNDNLDSPDRILSDIQANLTKILDNIPPPGDTQALRDLQQKEKDIKKKRADKKKEHDKKAALLDIPVPNFEEENNELKAIINQRKDVLKTLINNYLDKGIPNPKSIYFPKDKDKLKIDIPGIIKSLRILKEMKANFVPIKCGGDINFKDEMREVLKLMKIICPPQYFFENRDVSNINKIFLRIRKDPRLMDEDEFSNLVKEIKSTSVVITNIILRGNKFSVIKKMRKGSFSIIEECDYQGNFLFPPIKLTNSAPGVLKFIKLKNPIIEAIYLRLMEGMAKSEYTREDFAKYVRYEGEDPVLIIRVKDLKKLVAKKLGLSRRGAFDPERPLDREEPLISKFPHPEGPLCCLESLNGGFGNAISAFELPTVFPPKQDQISQTPGIGGIVQVTIPGGVVKTFIKKSIETLLNNGLLERMIPEINDIESPKFINLEPSDIQKIVRNMVRDVVDPNSPNIPDFLNIAKIPILPLARPTDMIEQALIGMGAPPPARIVYSLFWKYFKSLPKTPLSDKITLPTIEVASNVLSKIPWPLAVLLGRNVVNIINPLAMSDDHPVWRRMSLKNVYYVVYIDEFLRSAADVSGLFKFFLGSGDPVYPIPELTSELKKDSNVKKY
jgi:hypothetical protein